MMMCIAKNQTFPNSDNTQDRLGTEATSSYFKLSGIQNPHTHDEHAYMINGVFQEQDAIFDGVADIVL